MQWRLESELQKIGIEGMGIFSHNMFSHNVDDDIAKLGIKRIHKKLLTKLKKMTPIIDREKRIYTIKCYGQNTQTSSPKKNVDLLQ